MRNVSHLRRTEEDIGWMFTETVDIHDTDRAEVLTRHVEVKYNCEELIGCRFENSELINEINSKLAELRGTPPLTQVVITSKTVG